MTSLLRGRGEAIAGTTGALALCLLLTQPALAERSECVLDAAGNRTCAAPISCVTRATCIGGAGTGDQTCQSIAANGTISRECMPDCTTLFACGDDGDCPRIDDISPTCSPVASGTTVLPSICTWNAGTSTSVPLAAQITYCTPVGNHIAPSQITACHRRYDDPTIFTNDYFQGDCDGDGCPNGHDTNPCSVDPSGSCTPSIASFESPFCAPLPALACVPSVGGLRCGDARPCNPASASILPCPIGSCEDGWSDVPRCRPACGSLFLCATGALPGGGAPPEQCPMLNGATGQCAPLPASIDAVDGRDGLCIYPDFFDTSCVSSPIDAACFTRPDGMLDSNYYAGDCDGDGAPNACDTRVCASGGATMSCSSPAGDACTPSFAFPDAGLDASSDEDAGASQSDAGGERDDAGSNPGGDASSDVDGGGGTSFSGGGGCHCTASGRGPGSSALPAVIALGFVLAIRKRRW